MLLHRSRLPLAGGLAVTLLLGTTRVHAAPARVAVFEGKVHASKDAGAPVIHTFAEDARVSVSETPEDGWRQVRLPNGATGWIRSTDVQLVAVPAEAPKATSEQPAPPPPPPAPTGAPTVAATSAATSNIYVKDLRHLAELTIADQEVHPMAKKLADTERTASSIFWGGLVGGGVLSLLSVTALTTRSCTEDFGSSDPYCTDDPNFLLMFVGLGVMFGGMLIGGAVAPGRNDVLDVLNAWNTRHPDRQFSLK